MPYVSSFSFIYVRRNLFSTIDQINMYYVYQDTLCLYMLLSAE